MTATEWQRASGVRNGQTFRKLRDELQHAPCSERGTKVAICT